MGDSKKGPMQILHHNSANGIALIFGGNTNSVALNSNWYNLASTLQRNGLLKPFHK